MIYQIKFTETALKDIERHKKKWKQSSFKEISWILFGASGASTHRNWPDRTIETLRSRNAIEKNK